MSEGEGQLRSVADGLWTAAAPQRFLGLRLGCRMTVVRLADGGLLLHSPVPLHEGLRSALNAVGPVRHIVAPNLFHHLHLLPYREAWPDAQLHGAPGLADKRPDVPFDSTLHPRNAHLAWAGTLQQALVDGVPSLNEVVFFHPDSRTLIATDLVQHFPRVDHLPTRLYLKAAGVLGRPGVSRVVRLAFSDRTLARQSLDHVLAWPFERLIFAHGEGIESGGREVMRAAYSWLALPEA